MNSYAKWDGDEWQRHINSLLCLRFQPGKYQAIPDRKGGDFGLEGFSLDGIAFQCYAAEEPLGVEELTEKQRDKITRDIKKLCDNHAALATILGPVKLSTWAFVVPRFDDKHILVHAQKKSEEVRQKNLPIVTPNFTITVQDDSIFEREKASLMDGTLAKIPLEIPAVPLDVINNWTNSNAGLLETMDRKLKKLKRPESILAKLKQQMIKHYLEGQNALEFLHANYPIIEERVRACKEGKEKGLITESLLSTALPEQRLKEALADYRDRLADEVLGVTKTTADVLAHEAAADWLLRCPLDFAE